MVQITPMACGQNYAEIYNSRQASGSLGYCWTARESRKFPSQEYWWKNLILDSTPRLQETITNVTLYNQTRPFLTYSKYSTNLTAWGNSCGEDSGWNMIHRI